MLWRHWIWSFSIGASRYNFSSSIMPLFILVMFLLDITDWISLLYVMMGPTNLKNASEQERIKPLKALFSPVQTEIWIKIKFI